MVSSKLLKPGYLIEVQFLGFRFHGWQKQSEHKTIQETILTVLQNIFPEKNPKIHGSSRTDSMVSAEHFLFKLSLDCELETIMSFTDFEILFNDLLPADIKCLKILKMDPKFNIIQSPKLKEYHYYFTFGNEKPHPFCAPILTHIKRNLDLELMKQGAFEFVGTHKFHSYCFRPSKDKNLEKNIFECSIEKNTIYTANFFPANSFYIKVVGHSFVRHQVRLMAGTLFRLGLGEIHLEDIRQSLKGKNYNCIGFLAPASSLILHKIDYINEFKTA